MRGRINVLYAAGWCIGLALIAWWAVGFVVETPSLTKADSETGMTILLLGDSITQGKSRRDDSFRDELYALLVAGGYDVDFVGSHTRFFREEDATMGYDRDHEGHWGWRIDHILNGRTDDNGSGAGKLSEWLTEYTPEVALIHLGTNDAFQGESVASTISELSATIDALRADNPTVTILLAQLIPMTDAGGNARVAALNAAIPELAAATNSSASPVLVVDQNSGFDAARDTYDGVHPNDAGEAKIAHVWYGALVPLLQDTPTPTPTETSTPDDTPTPTTVVLTVTIAPPTVTETPTSFSASTPIPTSSAAPVTPTPPHATRTPTPMASPSPTASPSSTSTISSRGLYLPLVGGG